MSVSFFVGAAFVQAAAPRPSTSLELTPKLCVLSNKEPVCNSRIDIKWAREQPLLLCLFEKALASPLRCWQEQTQGEFQYQVNTDHSLTFQLRKQQDDTLLASEIYQVIRAQAQYRQRRRKPWNFF
jgi:hypothetical protein